MVLVGDAVEAAKQAEYPAEFLEQFTEKKLGKDEVTAVLQEFALNVSLGEIGEEAYSIVVTDRTQVDLMERARALRLKLVKERNRVERLRKEIKEPYKRKVDVIDGVGRILRTMMEDAERHLQLQEDYAENLRRAEVAAMVERRRSELTPYVDDINTYADSLEKLEEPAFQGLLENAKAAFEARKAEKERAEREAQAEAERLRIENERLRAEADAARLRQEAERREREEAERKQREAEDALRRERETKEREEAERKAEEEREAKRLADEAALAAAAPDREKLIAYIEKIRSVVVGEFPKSLESSIALAHAEVFRSVVQSAYDDLLLSAKTLRAETAAAATTETGGCPF